MKVYLMFNFNLHYEERMIFELVHLFSTQMGQVIIFLQSTVASDWKVHVSSQLFHSWVQTAPVEARGHGVIKLEELT